MEFHLLEAKNQIFWRASDTLEFEEGFTHGICFSFLNVHGWEVKKYLNVKFPNCLDKWKDSPISTQQWIEMFIGDIENKIVTWKVEEDFFYITLDLSVLSYQWALSILSLFRYAGEGYNICWMTWFVKENTKLSSWEALEVAHCCGFEEAPITCYYASGHSLFTPGSHPKLNIRGVFKTLDLYPPYIKQEEYAGEIQRIWNGPDAKYGPKITFKKENYEQ